MRFIQHFSYFLVAVLVFCPKPIPAQWEPTNGPYQGYIQALAGNDTNLFAGSDKGIVFHSTNGGTSWMSTKVADSTAYITSLAIIDSSIFALTNKFLYQSTDNGHSWKRCSTAPSSPTSLGIIDSSIFINATGTLYRSTDMGKSWKKLTSTNFIDPFSSDITIRSKTLCVINYDSVYASTDFGDTWETLGCPLPASRVLKLIATPESIYAVVEDHSAHPRMLVYVYYRYQTWNGVNTGTLAIDVRSYAYFDNQVYLGGYDGYIYKWWKKLDIGLHPPIYSLLSTQNKIYAGIGGGGVLRSDDSGAYWKPTTLGNTPGRLIVQGDTDVYVLGDCLMHLSGTDWYQLMTPVEISDITSMVLFGHTFFLGTAKGIYSSQDKGVTWSLWKNELADSSIVSLLALNSCLLAATQNHFYRSEDGGKTWVLAESGLENFDHSQQFKLLSIRNSNDILLATSTKFYHSTDNGIRWAVINANLPQNANALLSRMVSHDTSLFIEADLQLYRSDDLGISWTSLLLHYSNGPAIIGANKEVIIVAAGNDIFLSKDNGSSWLNYDEAISKELTPGSANNISALDVGNANVYLAIYGKGIWKRSLGFLSVLLTASSGNLFTGFPNPFAEVLGLRYRLDKSAMVRIDIYDLLGRSVYSEGQGYKEEGENSLSLQTKDWASGAYYIRLSTPSGEVRTVKVIKE
jgi:photosystem II stability/assembly factor-like uncharacterized protein